MLFTHPLGNVHTQQLGSPGFHLAQTRRSELALQSPAARTKATSSRSHPSSPQKKKGKEKKKKAVVFHVTHFPDLDAHLPDLDSRQLMLFFHVAWRCEESCWEPFANVPHLQPLSLDSHPTPKPHTHTHTHTRKPTQTLVPPFSGGSFGVLLACFVSAIQHLPPASKKEAKISKGSKKKWNTNTLHLSLLLFHSFFSDSGIQLSFYLLPLVYSFSLILFPVT